MSNGAVYATVKDALSRIDEGRTNLAALLSDVGVDCFVEGYSQSRDDIMDILLEYGIDVNILNRINNLKATDAG